MKQVPTPITAQRGTLRICNVPVEIPVGEALRNADWIAFSHLDVTPSMRPAALAWDFVKGATEH
jgi:hypothetical protein